MRIAVVGVGGVGGYFGGRLAQAGADVIFIARGDNLAALREQGLRIESIIGDAHVAPVQATDDPAQAGPVDMVLVATKTWQLDEAIDLMRPLIGPETGVVPLLNGVEASDRLAAALGESHALNGICYIFVARVAPGVVRHSGIHPLIIFGERDNRRTARVEALRDWLERAGVRVTIPPDIDAEVWRKFVFGATTSGLGAVTRAPMGLLRELPETRPLFIQGMREIVAVAQACGVALGEEAVTAALAQLDALPYETTASMQRDIMAGRPSELEAQNGAVARLGAAAGVPTPLHAFIYATLLPQERMARNRRLNEQSQ
ncbi:2-dehydropantoate 2-reductase [Roseiflexus sp. RS-1]|uniref:2-dehydropantoate 2-reductase n=1 Tax=Roseiflexus sp. (strain RS-1) TaxID=357808 RepID=UPI0000D7FEF1|nr:2-dehydropantoate 2-reductase [Roseiflexus sp. RS-1]ABQ88760.1 2-dehydropantoate 2-reductase [Roseiflexus sp. RS-1]MBO9322339.1 2-dehydropantoate 2-reductase [Roseiflexus sp.]